jgi:tetratricopeptide (TPR) repeat protein
MLLWASQAVTGKRQAAAFDFLDQAILLKPDFAEAWNRRATLNYIADDYGKSLADIERTLQLEPRHFGALMGLGAILEATDRKPEALETYLRVLDISPTLKTAQDAVGRLSEEMTGQRI